MEGIAIWMFLMKKKKEKKRRKKRRKKGEEEQQADVSSSLGRKMGPRCLSTSFEIGPVSNQPTTLLFLNLVTRDQLDRPLLLIDYPYTL